MSGGSKAASNEPIELIESNEKTKPQEPISEAPQVESEKLLRPLLHRRRGGDLPNMERDASILSKAVLFFMQGVISKASKLDADMDVTDLDLPAGIDAADKARDRFLPFWEEQLRKNPTNPSIPWALFWFLKNQVFLATFFALIEAAGPFTSVVLMKFINNYMLSFYTPTPDPMWHGGIIVCVFFIMQAIYSVGAAQSTRAMSHQEMRIEAALKMLMAKKAISLSGKGLKDAGGAGALFQNFSSDIGQVSQMLPFVWRSTEIFASMLGAFIYLGIIVGWPAVSSVVVLCCIIPWNYRISSSFLRYIIAKMMAGDKRTNKVIELLNSVRVIKFYAWEKPFRSVVRDMREPELVLVSKLMRQIAILMASFGVAAPIMQVILYFILVYGVKTPSPVVFYQSLSIITILSLIMIRAPFVYSAYLQVQNALQRLTASLTAEDRSDEKYRVSDECELAEVIIRDATFSWPPERPPPPPALPPGLKLPPEVMKKIAEAAEAAKNAPPMPPKLLKDVNFRANAGDFVMVVGKVGNGKSSLVAAILSEMAVESGSLARRGSVAYVPQTAWILNGTIRNNVLVHLPYDADRYQRVLEAVDLYVDFKALPNGDLTEVGEKGINLSGGQKQRISLARALYQDADIYVFDDPLSALDAHVGRHVFDVAMMTILAKKTRILVTHQLQYLQQATRIYVATDMTLVETKMPESVPAEAVAGESPLHVLLRAFHATSQASSPAAPSPSSPSNTKKRAPSPMAGGEKGAKSDGQLTVKEERQSGQVKNRTLLVYLGSFGTPMFWVVIVTLQVVIVCSNVFSQLWMGWWTGNKWPSLNARYPAIFFLGIYAGANLLSAVLTLIRELTWRTGAVNAPRTLYDRMTNAVLHAPMSFFDTTPVGRIINRFTRDAAQLDFQLPMAANQCITLVFTFIGSSAAICYSVPWSTPIFAAAIVALIFVQPTVAIVVLRRLSSAANGPVFALYSETLAGAVSIRALNIADFCTERFALLVDERNCSAFSDRMAFEYIRVQVNVLLGLVSALLMLVIILTRKHLDPTIVIFGINNSMTVTMYMGYVMLQRGQLMMALNAVERMMDYTELEPEKSGSNPAPESWPATGSVSFQNVTAQYRPGLPHALSDLTFTVHSGEKIGVVGRTGSGKSTLLLTIFRIIPLLGSSKIVIDGVDTGTIPLEQLRSKVAAIPQEPVLFSGTVQDNLDPFRKVPGEKLKEAIEMCHLSAPLEELRAKQHTATAGVPNADGSAKVALDVLDVRLTDGDLSVGQKQLLCLARAMARNARIIVLDEATSSVDVHTDAMIQQTIRTAFKEATIITVAHRLNTIMDSDRILVLDQGQLAEFDTPQALLRKEDSIFAGLAAEAQEQHSSPVAA